MRRFAAARDHGGKDRSKRSLPEEYIPKISRSDCSSSSTTRLPSSPHTFRKRRRSRKHRSRQCRESWPSKPNALGTNRQSAFLGLTHREGENRGNDVDIEFVMGRTCGGSDQPSIGLVRAHRCPASVQVASAFSAAWVWQLVGQTRAQAPHPMQAPTSFITMIFFSTSSSSSHRQGRQAHHLH